MQTIGDKIKNKVYSILKQKKVPADPISTFNKNGCIPWTEGYHEYKWKTILETIINHDKLPNFRNTKVKQFAQRIDERAIEYPWVFSQLNSDHSRLLDAGSTFNFKSLLEHEFLRNKDLSILTYYPESKSFTNKRISYVYADLRNIPFRDEYFDTVVCISTIEHIDMDNSIYGYSPEKEIVKEKNYEYLKVIDGLIRVTKNSGQVLLTFPYGRFENHGFFQQFDIEMVERITNKFNLSGKCEVKFFKYTQYGWCSANQLECNDAESHNPHTGVGKKDDLAAHSRAICCIKFLKNKF